VNTSSSQNKKESSAIAASSFAYEGLERVIHERARLSILSSLASHAQGVVFNDLKALCNLTDGNLSRQIQILQEAGFVDVWKGTKNNRPQTLIRLSEQGRRRFLEYINELEQVVANALGSQPVRAQASVMRGRDVSPA
jgi:DNA-binding MarR family transcriptional regulator